MIFSILVVKSFPECEFSSIDNLLVVNCGVLISSSPLINCIGRPGKAAGNPVSKDPGYFSRGGFCKLIFVH